VNHTAEQLWEFCRTSRNPEWCSFQKIYPSSGLMGGQMTPQIP
jgi:hypothetical protein